MRIQGAKNGPSKTLSVNNGHTPKPSARDLPVHANAICNAARAPTAVSKAEEKTTSAFAAASRDPNELRVRGTLPAIKAGAGDKSGLDLDATLATAHRFAEGGITDVTLPMGALTGDYREVPAKLDELMKAWHRAWSR